LSPPVVVYLIVCGAGPAADVPTFLNLANQAGWTVCVTATPQGAELMDVAHSRHLFPAARAPGARPQTATLIPLRPGQADEGFDLSAPSDE
jgi:hypothetical protein